MCRMMDCKEQSYAHNDGFFGTKLCAECWTVWNNFFAELGTVWSKFMSRMMDCVKQTYVQSDGLSGTELFAE